MATGPSEIAAYRPVTRLIKCPKCSWVGAMIVGYDIVEREETGKWICLKWSCRNEWEEQNPTVYPAIPDSQRYFDE